MNTGMIELRAVVKTYVSQAAPVAALKGIDLRVEQGEFLIITGRSGAGKTTLVNLVAGLDRATSGELWVAGAALHSLGSEAAARWRSRRVGVIFQTFELIPSLSVLHNVMLPMDFAGLYSLRQRRMRALELLDRVGIVEHANKRPFAISGGQQQRVAIARALANDPALLVADEPTGSLDSTTASGILELFIDAARQGCTVLLVTHDVDIACRAGSSAGSATRHVFIDDGRVLLT